MIAKDFRCKAQIRSPCGSILDNNAEDFGSGSRRELMHSLTTAKGKAEERKLHLYKGFEVHYFSESLFNEMYATAADSHVKKKMLLFITLIHPPSAGKSLKYESDT